MKDNEQDSQEKLSIKQKKDYAKHIYITEPNILHKELAQRVGVSANTIGRWVADGKWEELRASVITSKAAQLARLYKQLTALNDSIESRPEEARVVSSRDVDTLNKLTAAIRNLETETNLADKIEVGKEFLTYVRRVQTNTDTIKEVAALFDAYIKSCL